uniref:Uncharacterized protein n=1 Tax=Hemiselmis andersenii TaxID=464988 RepID=A0A7S0U2X0_HEMAN|mmetsp:Transcript_33082/g.77052  ORF Transcript_33082/g.77052 Transcript_33082/m.77052 type:complete len:498 (+) Transcript_33082:178-1671(+)
MPDGKPDGTVLSSLVFGERRLAVKDRELKGRDVAKDRDLSPEEKYGWLVPVGIMAIVWISSLVWIGMHEYAIMASERTLDAAEASYVSIPCSPIDPANNGKLVYASCPVTGQKMLNKDVPFMSRTVTGPANRIVSYVEVYQWHKWQEQIQGSDPPKSRTRTTLQWQTWHEWTNDNDDPYQQSNWDPRLLLGGHTVARSPDTRFGEFHLDDYHQDQIGNSTLISINCNASAPAVGGADGSKPPCPDFHILTEGGGRLFFNHGGAPANEVGANAVVTLYHYETDWASVLAQQSVSGSFERWVGPFDDDFHVDKIRNGFAPAEELLGTGRRNVFGFAEWWTRVGSFLLTFLALTFDLWVLCNAGVPLIHHAIYPIINEAYPLLLFYFCVTSLIWCTVVGSIWIGYRPWIGVPVLTFGLVCGVFVAIWRTVKYEPYQPVDTNNNVEAPPAVKPSDLLTPPIKPSDLLTPPKPTKPGTLYCPYCGAMKDNLPICPKCKKGQS